MKRNVSASALAAAIVWGFGLFALTWWIVLFNGATGEPTLIGHIRSVRSVVSSGWCTGFLMH